MQLLSTIGAAVMLARASPSSGRTEVNFDFAWRFRLGRDHRPAPAPPPAPPAGCSGTFAFETANNLQCGGLSRDPSGTTAALCKQACCTDNACAVWQWSEPAQSGGCWRGFCSGTWNKNNAWVGGNRSAPYPIAPPPPPLPPNETFPETKVGYDDSSWQLVNAPHDSLINQSANKQLCPDGCSGHSYLPRYDAWYRKHFHLPSSWAADGGGAAIWLRFDGVFRETTIWLNGVNISSHISGYTSFSVRLPNALLKFADEGNVIALLSDPNRGKTGWWYEGGGLYRHVHLVRTNALHIPSDGLFAYSNMTGVATNGAAASSASVHASVAIENDGTVATAQVQARFSLFDADGHAVGPAAISAPAPVLASASNEFNAVLSNFDVEGGIKLWGPKTPVLYTLVSEVLVNGIATGDAVNRSFGFRSLHYDSKVGMHMNGQHFKWRGFCDHDNFASLGMAVPDRVKLFRAQASRSVGGNGRRTSHNAPDPVMLDIYDRVGIAVMDEVRCLQPP